jgi:hypothetical protein
MEIGADGVLTRLEDAIEASGGPLGELAEQQSRIAVVARLEREEPLLFSLVRDVIYLSYYESPAVVRAIQSLGQPYRSSPLPDGYPVAVFDSATDTPTHSRGSWTRTDDVIRLDLTCLRIDELRE